jgi:NAD-dependent deacetylase
VRPDVVWFHEMLSADSLQDANTATQLCDVMLVVGTSGLVTPAATLPGIARQHGAKIIEVNPDDTPITAIADIKLTGASGEILPRLLEVLDTHA